MCERLEVWMYICVKCGCVEVFLWRCGYVRCGACSLGHTRLKVDQSDGCIMPLHKQVRNVGP